MIAREKKTDDILCIARKVPPPQIDEWNAGDETPAARK
jgi:hypothetical protein